MTPLLRTTQPHPTNRPKEPHDDRRDEQPEVQSTDLATLPPADRAAAAELRRLAHNTTILMNALMKACGDDEEMVKEIIESQGEIK